MPSWMVPVVAFGLLGWFGWSFYKAYRDADQIKRKKLIKLYAVLLVVSAALFCGIKFSGLSEKLFPEYFETFYQNISLV